jgi:DNA-binding NtrC family response regulator
MKKTILLIEDDPRVEQAIKSALPGYALETVKDEKEAAGALERKKPALVIIDHDLKTADGLQIFRQVRLLAPYVRVVMLSLANDIPLAVTATKLGAADFLRKPVSPKELLAAVERNASAAGAHGAPPAGAPWLQGEDPPLKKMYADIRAALLTRKNLVLAAERGIEKGDLAEYLHERGWKPKRQIRTIDLASFRRENLEGSFWSTVQEAVGESLPAGRPGKPAAADNEEDRCGTLFLENIESLEASFRLSIFEFFKEKKEKIDQEALVVIGLFSAGSLPPQLQKHYSLIEVPPLRERKADLPQLVSRRLAALSAEHNKTVKAISAELLYLFNLYDFPGNYHELEALLTAGVLASSSATLEIKDLPLDFKMLTALAIKDAHLKGKLSLESARRWLEKLTYKTLLAKNGGDLAAAARFLDLPRTALAERAAELGGDLLN